MLELGIKVKDRITGFKGTITARTEYLWGCNRYFVEPEVDENGAYRDGQSFDEDSLELIEDETVKLEDSKLDEPRKTGGPHRTPSRTKPMDRRY